MTPPPTEQASKVKERPIIFTDELVRVILAGKKTVTRRVVNPQPPAGLPYVKTVQHWKGGVGALFTDQEPLNGTTGVTRWCKYGVRGDRLWVREGVVQWGHERTGRNGQYLWPKFADEAAGRRWFEDNCAYTSDLRHDDVAYIEPHGRLNKMFAPRWASRITLELTDVKVERLHDISDADIAAEGFAGNVGRFNNAMAFAAKWREINGAKSWDANPFVWCLSFRRIDASPAVLTKESGVAK